MDNHQTWEDRLKERSIGCSGVADLIYLDGELADVESIKMFIDGLLDNHTKEVIKEVLLRLKICNILVGSKEVNDILLEVEELLIGQYNIPKDN